MDAISLIRNYKCRKRDGEKGRLCDMPDEILQKILSDLPTKEAVATSVLSKSWVHKWTGINKIDLEFDEDEPKKRQQFIDFVEMLLAVCNISRLKKFSLFFEVGTEAPRVNQWLNMFVNPMLEELNLELYKVQEPFALPDNLFTSEKLIRLELSIMSQVIKIPSTVNFKNLVTLTLKYVIFPNNYYTTKFFFGLPSLKEMTLIDCNWKNVGPIIIISPLLQKLSIRDWTDHGDDDDDDHHDNEEEEEEEEAEEAEELVEELNNGIFDINVALQGLNHHHGDIRILANELVSFSYDGDLMNDFSLFSSILVSDATIKVHEQDNEMVHAGYFVFKLFIAMFNVKKLSISAFALLTLCHPNVLAANLPKFFHLEKLRVTSTSAVNLSCQGLHTILRNSLFLEEIEFEEGVTMAENGGVINPLPGCFWISLKVIKIYNFCGSEGELNAIKYLLKSTLILDTLYIQYNKSHFDSPEGTETFKILLHQIDQFPKLSMDCDIEIE